MNRWLELPLLAFLLAGCNVASVKEVPSTIAVNQCQSSSECMGGVCDGGQCRSESTSLQKVLFEVTPPANGSTIAGVQFLLPEVDLSASNGEALELHPISQISGRVTSRDRKCDLAFGDPGSTLLKSTDSSVPARISLIPTTAALGLYSPRAVAQSSTVGDMYWGFSVSAPPGNYDIYVEPARQPDASCPVAPQLLRRTKISAGKFPLDINLPEPSTFEFHVTWPLADGGLDGWTVDMLDPVSGRVISNRIPLALVDKSKTDYRAILSYSLVKVVDEFNAQQDQLLRLSPPEGLPQDVALPTVLLARSGLALFGANHGTFTAFTALPTTVHVHGQVTSRTTPTPVAATTTLVADSIQGIADGVLASFSRTVNVGPDGQFDVYLPPGTYQVSTVPESPVDPSSTNESPLAADTRRWTVPAAPYEQAGKVIELNDALRLSGQVLDVSNAPVATAQVQAVPSTNSVQSSVLQKTVGPSTTPGRPLFVPRASAGGVSSTGEFALKTDPGTFDITVRPDANTGFSWLVIPNQAVLETVGKNLGTITMPLPFAYGGTVTLAGADGANVRVPGALVRAYIYTKDGEYVPGEQNADSLLQVGEARAGTEGEFQILIPAELNRRTK
ncbi:MAG TPA: hypothetical protein VFK05_06500 [Polyangiaceae bacterium]|nr:hypothetical protein [Polyangiaceae bacterium]